MSLREGERLELVGDAQTGPGKRSYTIMRGSTTGAIFIDFTWDDFQKIEMPLDEAEQFLMYLQMAVDDARKVQQ